jgi:SagB-type dehydrogenase family enzyme
MISDPPETLPDAPLLLAAGGFKGESEWTFFTPLGSISLDSGGVPLEPLLAQLDGTRAWKDIAAALPPHLKEDSLRMLELLVAHHVVRATTRLHGLYYDYCERPPNESQSAAATYPIAKKLKRKLPAMPLKLRAHLVRRSSTRAFKCTAFNPESLLQLLWSMYGTTPRAINGGIGTVPSAGAFYSMSIYVLLLRDFTSLDAGIYLWDPAEHALRTVELSTDTDFDATVHWGLPEGLRQTNAPVLVMLVSDIAPVVKKYGIQALKFAYLEAGHCLQNAYLATAELGLGIVEVGNYRLSRVGPLLGLGPDRLYIASALVGCPDARA